MSILYGNTVLTEIRYGSQSITQISYLGGIYKLRDYVDITFIEGGTETTVQYDVGETIYRPSVPPGAVFVGWSSSPSGENPVQSFTASQDATYYRVIRYEDRIITTFETENNEYIIGPFFVETEKYPILRVEQVFYSYNGTTVLSTSGESFSDADKHAFLVAKNGIFEAASRSPFYIYTENIDGRMTATVSAIGSEKVVG